MQLLITVTADECQVFQCQLLIPHLQVMLHNSVWYKKISYAKFTDILVKYVVDGYSLVSLALFLSVRRDKLH